MGSILVRGLRQREVVGRLPSHLHAEQAQLMYAASGMMSVTSPEGRWILPPGRALWISAETEHGLEVRRPTELEILYLGVSVPGLPSWRGCRVVNVSPLVRALIDACLTLDGDCDSGTADGRLVRVLLDQMSGMSHAPVNLPQPRDARTRRVAQLALDDVENSRSLQELAREAGASERTVERLFKSETGMSFGAWRLRARMIAAVERLATGASVQTVAHAIGYENPSSFIATFRTTFGRTPGTYFDAPPAALEP